MYAMAAGCCGLGNEPLRNHRRARPPIGWKYFVSLRWYILLGLRSVRCAHIALPQAIQIRGFAAKFPIPHSPFPDKDRLPLESARPLTLRGRGE